MWRPLEDAWPPSNETVYREELVVRTEEISAAFNLERPTKQMQETRQVDERRLH